MSDQTTFATKDFRLGPWMRHRRDEHAAMYESSAKAPHLRFPHLGRNDPANQLGVVWADTEHRIPLRVIDGDGCTAVVLEPQP